MIDGHEKFRMEDIDKKAEWFLEVNWNEKDEKTNNCKVLRITHPDKTESFIKKEHLNAVLFAIGNAAEQREMIPQVVTKTKHYSTVVSVKATKDIRKGEEVTFPIELTLPADKQEKIGTAPKPKHHIIGTGTKINGKV